MKNMDDTTSTCWRCLLLVFAMVIFGYTASAQSLDKLEQAANGKIGSDPTTPVSWITGNVNAAKAHYATGMTIPYRLGISGLSTGVNYQVTIGYDTKKNGKHAIDFLTSYDRPTYHDIFGHLPEPIDPLSGLLPAGTPFNDYPLPAPTVNQYVAETGKTMPIDAFNAAKTEPAVGSVTPHPLYGFSFFRIYNGAVTNLTYVAGTGGDTSSDYIRVDFTADAGTVVLAWGGHIASEDCWGEGMDATAISGSPYHMFITSNTCVNIGGCGAKDVQLAASAVIAPPTCEVEGPDYLCENTNGMFEAFSDVAGVTYAWVLKNFGTNATIIGPSNAKTLQVNSGTLAGYFQAEVTITYSSGGMTVSSTCYKQTDVVLDPAVSVADQAECDGDGTATFSTANLGAGYTYQWYLNNVIIPGATSNSYTTGVVSLAMNGNVYKVVVTHTETGCDSEDSGTLTVWANPAVSVADQAECDGDGAATFSTANLGAGYTYQWYLNNVIIPGATSNSYTTGVVSLAMNGNVYKVVVTHTETGCDSEDSGTLTVWANPTCEITSTTNASCGMTDGSATVLVSGGLAPYDYDWRDGTNIQIGTLATIDGLAPGTYKVYITDANGCKTDCEAIIGEDPCEVNCETAYGYLEDGAVCFIPPFSQWGWTIPFNEGEHFGFPLYAGAANCDITKGWGQVGWIEVDYDSGTLTVTYTTYAGYSMSEVHVYVGCGMFPVKKGLTTVAPGQYTHNSMILDRAISYTVEFTDVHGPIWLIAHAVVCDVSGTLVVSDATYTNKIDCGSKSTGLFGVETSVAGDREINIQVMPNPFRNQTQILFNVDRDTRALVEVYTLQGSRVAVLFDQSARADESYEVSFEAPKQAGRQIYLVVVRTDYGLATKQIIAY